MKRAFAIALVALVTPCAMAWGQYKELAIKSSVLGEDRVALVRTPAGYDHSDQRYPVLYMTDGAAHLDHTGATIAFLARTGWMPEMIVVAIVNTDRTRDLTPTKAPEGKKPPAGGGADKFLQFIETELIPQVEKTYRTQPYRAFAGHSFGGLLALHAFATKNDLFDAYIAASPSTWWDNEVVIREMEDFLKGRKELKCTLFMTLAREEGPMRSGFDKTKALLGSQHLQGFTWDSMLLEDEHHGSVVLRSHYFGLKKIFDGWQLSPAGAAVEAPAIEEHFKKLSAKYKYTILPPEQLMNQVGYQLFGDGKKDEAIAVFKLNAERYSNSANVYDSLAEAYEKTGKLDLAKPNYERAVQLGTKNKDPFLKNYQANFDRVSKALSKESTTPDK
jgi:predicted alpha/beta superfamily hydrolase